MYSKALVADDDFYNRALARLVLENAGYVVAEAENGVAALERLAHETYDLLILDLVMPELDGIGVLAEIRKSIRHNPMKVIVVTAHPEGALDTEIDADYVMYKPINIQIFKAFLRSRKSSRPAER